MREEMGLAKNRMVISQKNPLRDEHLARKHWPKAESHFWEPEDGEAGVLQVRARRDDPLETAIVRRYLASAAGSKRVVG